MSFAMKWKKLIASDITLATSWKGQLKLIFWMDGTVVEEPPNSPSGPRRECAAQAVFAAGENLGAGAYLPTPSIEIPKGGDRLWRSEPKTKGHPKA